MARSPIAVSPTGAAPTKIPGALLRRREGLNAAEAVANTPPVVTPTMTPGEGNGGAPPIEAPGNSSVVQPVSVVIPPMESQQSNVIPISNFDEASFIVDDEDEPVAPAPVAAAPVSPPNISVTHVTPAPAAHNYQLNDHEARLAAREAQLEARFAQLEARLQAASTPQATPQPAPHHAPQHAPKAGAQPAATSFVAPNFEIDAKTRESMPTALPVITDIATRAAQHVYDLLAPQIAALHEFGRATHQELSTTIQGHRQATYANVIAAQIPDAESLLSNPLTAEFLDRPIPYSNGQTVKSRLHTANSNEDANTVIRIFHDLRTYVTNKGGATPAQPTPSPTVVSASPQAPRVGEPKSKAKLAWSKRQAAFTSFRSGKLSQADINKVQALYAQAEADGRIDYDK